MKTPSFFVISAGSHPVGVDDAKKAEITKDVSAFANSAGGVLIYGIAEPPDRAERHKPGRPDPICRANFSKEWLEQIIQSIQPRIDGVNIIPVEIDAKAGTVWPGCVWRWC